MSCIQFLSTVKYFKVISLQIKKKVYISFLSNPNGPKCKPLRSVGDISYTNQLKFK